MITITDPSLGHMAHQNMTTLCENYACTFHEAFTSAAVGAGADELASTTSSCPGTQAALTMLGIFALPRKYRLTDLSARLR